jgi:acyl carrier protein
MTRAEIESALRDIVRQEKPDIAVETFTAGTALAEVGIDSLDALTILFAIEEQFKISIPDAEARNMKTFGDIVGAVENLLAAAK